MRKTGFFLAGAIIGGAIGALISILLAPASGIQTRAQITDYVQNVSSEVRLAALRKREELEQELSRLRAPETKLE